MSTERFHYRLRRAGALILAGMAVQLGTFSWASPAAFLVFALVGATLVALGALLFLWTIARATHPPDDADEPTPAPQPTPGSAPAVTGEPQADAAPSEAPSE
ncbi:MAG: hypothetical protein AB7N76_18645 [Planctomycetota bacterium]